MGGLAIAAALACAAAPEPPQPERASRDVVLLTVDGPISPASADYVVRGMHRAAKHGAQAVVLRIDTPGGLDTSMRTIVKEILASPVPVVVFVAPGGARAASAGTFILYAAHVAAMAPATNLGAASPVRIGAAPGAEPARPAGDAPAGARDGEKGGTAPASGDTLTRKITHDAAAYIRSLAQLRGRNADWGEQAVREAVSISARDALDLGVIDLMAENVPDLMRRLDGRKVTVQDTQRVFATADAATIEVNPDWRSELLAVVANPGVALILMMIGIYGLIFEFSNPGFIVPGVVGAICLLLAFYAFQLLPINHAGVALILLGTGFLVAEAFAPSFGVLGIGGLVALVIGAVILVDPEVAGAYAVPVELIVAIAVAGAALLFATVVLAMRARRRPVASGREDMIGACGEAIEDCEREGWARVHGENWRVTSTAALARGQKVRVVAVDGLTLRVEPTTEPGRGT